MRPGVRAILTYHSVDPSGSPISLPEERFREQVGWLADGPVRVVPLPDLLTLDDQVDAVSLTFDDGFQNFGTVAAPLLADHGFPSTVFVVTGHVGRTNQWAGRDWPGIPTLALLDWDALGRLAESGVEVGAHTRHHPVLPRCTPTQLDDELYGAADEVEARVGRRPTSFAYPFGALNGSVAQAAGQVYQRACTTTHAALRAPDRVHRLPRIDMWYFRAPGALTGWGSPRFRGRVRMRRALRGLRRAMLPRAIG